MYVCMYVCTYMCTYVCIEFSKLIKLPLDDDDDDDGTVIIIIVVVVIVCVAVATFACLILFCFWWKGKISLCCIKKRGEKRSRASMKHMYTVLCVYT